MSRENSHTPSYPENFLQNVSWVASNSTIHLLALRKKMHPTSWCPAVPHESSAFYPRSMEPVVTANTEPMGAHNTHSVRGENKGTLSTTLSFSQGLQDGTNEALGLFSESEGPSPCLLVQQWEPGEGRRWAEPVRALTPHPGFNSLSGKGEGVPELSPPCTIRKG